MMLHKLTRKNAPQVKASRDFFLWWIMFPSKHKPLLSICKVVYIPNKNLGLFFLAYDHVPKYTFPFSLKAPLISQDR